VCLAGCNGRAAAGAARFCIGLALLWARRPRHGGGLSPCACLCQLPLWFYTYIVPVDVIILYSKRIFVLNMKLLSLLLCVAATNGMLSRTPPSKCAKRSSNIYSQHTHTQIQIQTVTNYTPNTPI
jgi:hypothetical protein